MGWKRWLRGYEPLLLAEDQDSVLSTHMGNIIHTGKTSIQIKISLKNKTCSQAVMAHALNLSAKKAEAGGPL